MLRLTAMRRRFIEAYEGNATKAALMAGYSEKTAYSQGQRLLKNVEIVNAILHREKTAMSGEIADRKARQKFWTEVMQDDEQPMPARLKASELLGKSEGDFLDRVEAGVQVAAQPPSPREVMAELLRQKEEREREAV